MIRKIWFAAILIFLVFADAQTALGAAKGLPDACILAIVKAGGFYKGNIKPAIWRFQRANKIKPSGLIDEKTEKALIRLSKKHPKVCAQAIKKQKKPITAPLNTAPLPDVEKGLPDLIITNFSLNPRFPAAGEEVKLEVEIRNIGSSTARNMEYGHSIIKDGSIDYQVLIACEDAISLKPGESCISRTNVIFKSQGVSLVILKVDPETKIEESNEDNNSFSMLGVQVYDSSAQSDRIKVSPVQDAIVFKNAFAGQKNVEFLKFKVANGLNKDIKVLSLNLVLLGNAKPQDIDAIHWYDDNRELGSARFTDYGSGQNFASINSNDPPGCSVPKECREMLVVGANKEKVITITSDISENAPKNVWAVFAMMESFYVVTDGKFSTTGSYPITGNTVLISR